MGNILTPLKRMRSHRHWSQMRLAGLAEVTHHSVISLERDNMEKILNIPMRTVVRLAVALECSPADICPFLGRRPKIGVAPGSEAILKEAQRRAKKRNREQHEDF